MKRKMMKLRKLILLLVFPLALFSQQSQEKGVEKKVMNYLAQAETYYQKGNMAMAEASYRKALALAPDNDLAQYNFGNLYINYKKENEALLNLSKATRSSKNESIKHKSLHNQGNILMENKKYAQAAKAYKKALKNDPTDDETRYNYVLAKELMEKQKNNKNNKDKKKQDKKKKKNKKEQNKNKKGGQGQNEKDKKENKEEPKDPNKEEEGKGDPKKNKDKQAKEDQQKKSDKKEKKKSRKAELSKQQVKNILKAIENSEKEVQKKLNKQKKEGKPVRTEKDW
jgi:tetratricopeptide (TPR) repeat protein